MSLISCVCEYAEAITVALIEILKVVWQQNKYKDPMKIQLSSKSLTEETIHAQWLH
jgi:hypothetical protein